MIKDKDSLKQYDNGILEKYKESKSIIRQAMEDRQLVIFVGSGASIASGMPSWKQAIECIEDKMSINDKKYDYLRVPQYYYNARGKKEYTQLMRKIFRHGEFLSKHAIHDKIIGFNTETIITTNYDHLIEQAAEENGQALFVVSKDSDLPYRRGGKELIKMHGDFENDNFVLKEQDYLLYSKNFNLIENYVKSIIGTKVVLFVGYSFSDPDLKLIFSWVKDILSGDFQNAYLIEAGGKQDINEEEYFRQFGINIMYASIQLKDAFKENDKTNNLLLMLEWLLNNDEIDKIDLLYNNLKPFTHMNYTCQKYIRNAMWGCGIILNNRTLTISDTFRKSEAETERVFKSLAYAQWTKTANRVENKEQFNYQKNDGELSEYNRNNQSEDNIVEEYLKDYKEDKKKRERISEIVEVICKSNVICMEGHLPSEKDGLGWKVVRVLFNMPLEPKWMNAVNTYNYKELRCRIRDNNAILNETSPELYMEQGYIYYVLGDFIEAYNCYKNAKMIYYKRQDYIRYFIAEFSRFVLGKMISEEVVDIQGDKSDIIEKIKEEYKVIDLERAFNSLPDLGESNKILKDIYTFNVAHTLFRDAYKSSIKVEEQATTSYDFFAGQTAFAEMREDIKDYYNYISWNCLPVNYYNEHINIFCIYFQSIISSVNVNSDGEDTDINNYGRTIHVEKLDRFDMLVALKFVDYQMLKRLTDNIDGILPISNDGLEYVKDVINKYERSKGNSIFARDDVFYKCLIFLGKCLLSRDVVQLTTERMKVVVAPFECRVYSAEISIFLKNAQEQSMIDARTIDNLKNIINKDINYISNNKEESYYHCNLLLNMVWVIKENGQCYDEVDIIKQLIHDETKLLCVRMYHFLGDNSKQLVVDAYSNWKYEGDSRDFEFYYYLVDSKIVKPDAEIEKKIFEYLLHNRDDGSDIEGVTIVPVTEDNILIKYLVELYLKGLIIDKKTCEEIIAGSSLLAADWLLKYKEYDYSQFDVNWLLMCSESLREEILKDDVAGNKIKKAIEEQYNKEMSREVVDIYFLYFSDMKRNEVEKEEG